MLHLGGREPSALMISLVKRLQVRVIEPQLQLEGPIGQVAGPAQQRDRLIHDCDKLTALLLIFDAAGIATR